MCGNVSNLNTCCCRRLQEIDLHVHTQTSTISYTNVADKFLALLSLYCNVSANLAKFRCFSTILILFGAVHGHLPPPVKVRREISCKTLSSSSGTSVRLYLHMNQCDISQLYTAHAYVYVQAR